MGIGYIFRRIVAKCVLFVIGTMEMEACRNLNLFTGSGYGIEIYVYITLLEYGKDE